MVDPLAWRQLQDQPRRMRRDTVDDIVKINQRIALQMLTGLHEGTQDGGSVRRVSASAKQATGTDTGRDNNAEIACQDAGRRCAPMPAKCGIDSGGRGVTC